MPSRCPEIMFGGGGYFAGLAVLVGALMRLVKRAPWLPADAVPIVAFVVGWGIDGAVGAVFCGRPIGEAALVALGGGFAGLAAAGGHELVVRSARIVGLGAIATRVMGRAQTEYERRARATAGLIVLLLTLSSGCAAARYILRGLEIGSGLLGSALDSVDTGKDQFFDRHPMPQSNPEAVASQLLEARLAHQRCTEQIAADDESKAKTACAAAVQEYDELYRLLDAIGVLEGKCRNCGGAEGDAPEPKPLPLPPPHVVAAHMGEV